MTSQTTFYQPDPSLDSSIAPESLFLGQEFSPEFLPLSLLEKDGHHHDLPMEHMQFPPHQPAMVSVRAMQGESTNANEDMMRPRYRNRALRPAPRDTRKDSTDDFNQPGFFNSYGPMPSFSSFSSTSTTSNPAEQDPEFRFSPHSDISSNKSSSPLRWQTGDAEKRAKHLERNRAAASKSRQKKKRETDQLRTRFQEVSRRKSTLEIEIKELHSQLLSLKDQILMHSRCDDEAIHLYLGRMVKQATKHDSISSASSGTSASSREQDDEGDRSFGQRHGSECISPRQTVSSLHTQGPPHHHNLNHSRTNLNPTSMDLSNAQQGPMRMGDGSGLPCGVEKPIMNQMFSQHDPNDFDLQISIS
ncbi:bZIP transcription factor [Aspergillus foveolatus]|uniref:bZIP transcription factor n=1 Tax=Aspergillus foveolatus TaxID=210207 RepID=UPI003CCCC7B1